MIAPNFSPLCREAEPYYFYFLHEESHASIPEPLLEHIKQCYYCQDQALQLKSILSKHEDLETKENQTTAPINTILKLHFDYIGREVTCKTARPFFPALLDPALSIRIPTPITAHLDHCPQCAGNLETIRSLNLSCKQLRCLSRLFAAKPEVDDISCSQAYSAIMACVSMAFHKTSQPVLKHLCVCNYCRKVLYQYRETVIKDHLHEKGGQKSPLCSQVSVSDIFDYAIPYDLDPANDQYAKFRDSLTSHIQSCPICLAKMQQLHDTIYGIIERAESEVVTIYNVDESAGAAGESDELYSGFPIKVDVLSTQREKETIQPVPTINLTEASKKKIPTLKGKTKWAAAAAVFAVAALLLFLSMPSAQAVTIDKIYKAIEKIKNVHIVRFNPKETEPIQEEWISRTANYYMIKTGNETVLWDLSNKIIKTKQSNEDLIETTLLFDSTINDFKKRITSSLGFMPFADISDIPKDAQWEHVNIDDSQVNLHGTEVYDLTWTVRTYSGSVYLFKWRVFVDDKTNFPQRTESYRKFDFDDDFKLTTITIVEYLSDSEIQTAIQNASF